MKKLIIPHGPWLLLCLLAWWAGQWRGQRTGTREQQSERIPVSRPADEQSAPTRTTTAIGASSSVNPGVQENAGQTLPDALRKALREPDEFVREQKFGALMSRMTPEDAPHIQALFEENDKLGRWFVPEYNMFMLRWGQVDGLAAAEFGRAHFNSNWSEGLMQRIMRGWAQSNPSQAVDWINSQESLPDWMSRSSMRGLVDGYALRDLHGAAKMLSNHLDDPVGRSSMELLLDRFIQIEGLPSAENWFNSLPQEAGSANVKGSLFPAMLDRFLRGGDASIDGAAQMVARHAGQPWVGTREVVEVMKRLQKADPVKAAAWADSLPDGELKSAAQSTLNRT